jgi:predicted Fe-Mo cluster-binding NifX family protein
MLDLVRGCEVVIAAHIGAPMVASLTQLGVRVLGTPTESVGGAIQAYLRSLQGGPALEVLRAGVAEEPHQHEHARS